MNPSPSHTDGTCSMVESPPCRTTTPLGCPVVPDVYMMSATSSGPSASGTSVSSWARRSPQATEPPVVVLTTVGSCGENLGLHVAAQDDRGARVREDPGRLGRSEPGQERDRHRSCLVDGQVGHEPLERFFVADEQPDAVAAVEPTLLEAPGQPVRQPVPLAQGELGPVGQVPPHDRSRVLLGQLGHQLRLEQRHGGGTRGAISRGRRLRGWSAGSPRASSRCRSRRCPARA